MSTVPRGTGRSNEMPAPMQSLHDRIDEVRQRHPDFSGNLRDVASELPHSSTRRKLLQLAVALDENQSPASLANSFPQLRWLLTVPSSTATTDLLTVMLEQSTYYNALQQRRFGKAAYPCFLMAIGFTVFFFICLFIVPTFQDMYGDFGIQLPGPTRLLFSVASFIDQYAFVAILIVACTGLGVGLLLWAWISEGPLKRLVLGYTPKSSQTKFSLAGAAQQLADLSEDGVPLDRALRITAESSTEPTLRAAIGDLANQAVTSPQKLTRSRAAFYLPPNFLLAIQSDPDAPSRINAPLMRALASNYRDLSVHRRDWTSFLLGPIAFLCIGVMILFVITSLFSPLISLVSALS